MPSSLAWISVIIPMKYLAHIVPNSCINTMSPSFDSCRVLWRHLSWVFRMVIYSCLHIFNSCNGSRCFLGAPACFTHRIPSSPSRKGQCVQGVELSYVRRAPWLLFYRVRNPRSADLHFG
ncbi:hypothetical protein Tsp_05123 [Trichinella spiralis]|uniref:Uncharacterized protein n=1 Tax=Trichinella spiralis TaxID=6334 RepID=E5SX35_TRISP|nr:hypothetical protein Tsp_05123 [Trichinella spiralis]KRY40616.1 hypothetical protein T01_7871 [Trichinella spiralis]